MRAEAASVVKWAEILEGVAKGDDADPEHILRRVRTLRRHLDNLERQLGVEPLTSQVDRLANFIMADVPGEPSQSEGAIDTAIRLLRGGTATAMNCPPAWVGQHSDTFAFVLAGALSTVMLPGDQEMPEQQIRETIEHINSVGPGNGKST